ncbi:MAG: magnesium/cobalt transporter CorA [Bacteroidetes bacterium]|nr:magnesium/cobalt transporter CorA [Bacteroidota bacterium]
MRKRVVRQKLIKKHLKRKPGLPPGSLIRQNDNSQAESRLSYFLYNQESIEEKHIHSLSELPKKTKEKLFWMNVVGLNDIELLRDIGKIFNLHPLLLEDIINTDQRPKFDDFENRISLMLRLYDSENNEMSIEGEQITLVMGEGFVISFLEKPTDIFEPVFERLRKTSSGVRSHRADYLLYVLADLIIDHYFVFIENLGVRIEDLEDSLFTESNESNLEKIHSMKTELLSFRRYVFPLREAISQIQRSNSTLIEPETQRFWTDAYDHVIRIIDLLENYRELNTSLRDIYLSGLSIKMNRIMQLLTIISTIFIPLTFIVGVYGMNFHNMPELEWRYGYYMIWCLMSLIVIGMLLFFKRKKWL